MPPHKDRSDTQPAAERWLLEQLRGLDPAERLGQIFAMIEFGFQLEEAGLRLREPELTGLAFEQRLAVQRFGPELGGKVAQALANRATRMAGEGPEQAVEGKHYDQKLENRVGSSG